MITSLIQKNSPEAKKRKKKDAKNKSVPKQKIENKEQKSKEKTYPHHPKIVLWLLSMHGHLSE